MNGKVESFPSFESPVKQRGYDEHVEVRPMICDKQHRALVVRASHVLEAEIADDISRDEADRDGSEVPLAERPESLDRLTVHVERDVEVDPFDRREAGCHVGWQRLVDQVPRVAH